MIDELPVGTLPAGERVAISSGRVNDAPRMSQSSTKRVAAVFLTVFWCALPPLWGGDFKYGDSVTLAGTVEAGKAVQGFGVASPANGVVYFLKPSIPLNVLATPSDDLLGATARDVQRVQILVSDDPAGSQLAALATFSKTSAEVIVEGKLIAAHTAHHQTPVLLHLVKISSN